MKKIKKQAKAKALKKSKQKAGPVFKPLPASQLKNFKKELLALQATLSKKIEEKKNRELVPTTEMDPGDDADAAVQTYEKEMLFEIAGSERETLMDVEDALRRIDSKIFGQCQRCQKMIPMKRLRVLSYTKYCINCQTLMEPARYA